VACLRFLFLLFCMLAHFSRTLACDEAIARASSSYVLLSKPNHRLPHLCSLQRQKMSGETACLTTGAKIRSLVRAMMQLRAQLAEGRKVQDIPAVSNRACHAGLPVVIDACHQSELFGGVLLSSSHLLSSQALPFASSANMPLLTAGDEEPRDAEAAPAMAEASCHGTQCELPRRCWGQVGMLHM
jgi:hypothetical protein